MIPIRFSAPVLSVAAAALLWAMPADARELPVTRVILSTSGLAHFEHEAAVTGDETLELTVRLDQVDDILKSLVVFDAKGRIGGITLPGRRPLSQIFRDLPFGQGDLNSPVALLNAYQGASVTVGSGIGEIEGKLVRIVPEMLQLPDGRSLIQHHRVSIVTSEGLKQFILEDLKSITFNDAKVRGEIERALSAVREHGTQERRTLDISLKGDGRRDVALSYVLKAPLWKSAYRMVLPEGEEEKGFIQGWAVIENMTSTDWKNVELALTSGNPVTFRQDLYQSYYAQRPVLPVEVLGRVMPRVDTGAIAPAETVEAETDGNYGGGRRAELQRSKSRRMAAAPAPMAMESMASGLVMADDMDVAAPGRGGGAIANAANAAHSDEATTQVLFRFPDTFDLGAGDTLMLPFVSCEVPMERVALYQPDVHARHPLAAVRLENDGGTGLPPGILTLYEQNDAIDGTSFVGDAQMPVLGNGEDRLISYALDSKTQIDRNVKNTQAEGRVTISQGVMKTAMKYRNVTEYTISAPAKEGRTVLLEHPRMGGDYKIVSPAPKDVEVTATHYRVKVPVKPGEAKKLDVVLERDGWQTVHITNMSIKALEAYAGGSGKLSNAARKAFAEMADMRRSIDEIDRKISEQEKQKSEIFNDQQRVRRNLSSVDRNSQLRHRYMERMNEQEDRIEKIDVSLLELREERDKRLARLQKYIAGLNFD